MAYFDAQRNELDPKTLLNRVIDQALCVLDIGDETALAEITPHRKVAALIAREYGLEEEAAAGEQRLADFIQKLEAAFVEGSVLPELQADALPKLEMEDPGPADTLKILWGLFILTAKLEDAQERGQALDLAAYMMDFLDLEGKLARQNSRAA